VRAAPNRKMAADWQVSPWRGGTVIAMVRNALRRATVAQSPAWMRVGSLGRARRRARG
jgi:hypothetical protein